ncbi:MAG: hypothetical protein G8345_10415 [Magnetococcales bacterium]|nr:hypothetical protein [Magnetococcales bacterium]
MTIQKLTLAMHTEHGIIKALISELNADNLLTREGQKKLLILEELLINHLQMEETQFYPMLYQLSHRHPEANIIVEALHKATRPLSMDMLYFFQQLHQQEEEPSVLQEHFTTIIAAFHERMALEEYQLMELLNQLAQAE